MSKEIVYQFKIINLEYQTALLKRLEELGFGTLSVTDNAYAYLFCRPNNPGYGVTAGGWSQVDMPSSGCRTYIEKTLVDLFTENFKTYAKVKLNDSYSAHIVGDTIKVGCQEFPAEKIKELYDILYR